MTPTKDNTEVLPPNPSLQHIIPVRKSGNSYLLSKAFIIFQNPFF